MMRPKDGIASALRRALLRFHEIYAVKSGAGTRRPLTVLQVLVLDELAQEGEASLSDLGRALGIDKSTCSDMLIRMEKAGLVTRRAHGRNVSVEVSPEGRNRLRAARRQFESAEIAFQQPVESRGAVGLLKLINKLGTR